MAVSRKKSDGFTLVEIIASLVIIGILALMTGVGISNIYKGYLYTKDNASTSLRAQVALTRLMKELGSVESITNGSKTSLTYAYIKNGTLVSNRTVSWAGSASDPLMLGGNILARDINDFELTYYASYSDAGDNVWNGTEKMIGVTLKLSGAMGEIQSFGENIVPRNF